MGPLDRARANTRALETLHRLRDTGAEPTADDARTLAAYTGWGGQPDAFRRDFSHMPGWQDVNARLRSLMSDDEYEQAAASTLTAFYTPAPVIHAIAGTLDRLGFGRNPKRPDTVLEPGCGTGNFPRAMTGAYTYTGIETDATSARIAGLLLPQADILNAGMEDCVVPDGAWDLAVGNVPYSQDITLPYGPSGRSLPIHDWFILRSLDALRPGGVAALLTSRYTLDKTDPTIRLMIARKADLVAAVRLPAETFRSAGTDIVSDILVLRRHDTDDATPAADPEWIGITPIDGVPVNRMIASHPETVIGDMHRTSGPHGPTITVESRMTPAMIGQAAAESLDAQTAKLGDLHARLGRAGNQAVAAVKPSTPTTFEHFADEHGNIWYGDGRDVTLVHSRTKGGDQRLSDMLDLRDRTANLISAELDPTTTDADVTRMIADLDHAYDRFAARWGRLCDKANRNAFDPADNDPTLHQLYALERADALGRYQGKADILTTRVATPVPPMPDHADDPRDALDISLDREGHVDMPLIARLLDTTPDQAALRLGDDVIQDPDTGRWATADEYLSGDVTGKLEHVEHLIDEETGRAEREREASWLDHTGLDAILRSTYDRSRTAMTVYRTSGAYTAAMDPLHAATYVDTEAWADQFNPWSEGRHAAAILADMLDDVKPGAVTYHAITDNEGEPAGYTLDQPWSFLAGQALTRRDASTPRNTRAMALYRIARADPAKVGDRFAALFLKATPLTYRGPQDDDPLYTLTDPACWNRETYQRKDRWGGAKTVTSITLRDPDRLARQLRDDPVITEYILHTAVNDGGEATPQGLAAYRAERNAYTAALDVTPTDTDRLDRLAHLADRLRAVQPAPLQAEDIGIGLGSAWVPPSIIHRFIRETILTRYHTKAELRKLRVSTDETTGTWQIKAPGLTDLSETVRDKYSSPDRTPFKLIEAALNGSTMTVTKPDPDDPNGRRTVTDPAGTAAAWDKRHAIEREFTRWAWADPERARTLTALYNRRFNNLQARTYDGSRLTLPGMNNGITLRAHQKDAVARILRGREGTLIAHCVGAGKTYTTIAACHEAVRLGKAAKPLVAVPNHLTEQWAEDWARLYPGSRILAMTQHDMSSTQAVQRFWGKVATGNWDAVIVGHSRFSRLHLSTDISERYYRDRLRELIESRTRADENGNDFSVKQLQAQIQRLSARLEKLRDTDGENTIPFDRLGVDMIAVDEAHMFKNLAIATNMNVAGMNVAASAKCEDMLDKCRWMRETGHGSNIVFATGTPVSNTMAELYNMERYLAPDLLENQHVTAFSSWANTYGDVIETVEVKPEGNGFRIMQRFARFKNLPELMNAVHTFADVKTEKDIDLDTPDVDNIDIAVEPTPEQKELIRQLAERAEAIRNGKVDPHKDNMLKITSDGVKISLDPKLLDPDAQPLEGGKVAACADNIARIWRDTTEPRDGQPGNGAQLVFCDSSTPHSGNWNIYDDLKRRLVEHGIPENQIAFVHDAKTPIQREQLFEKVREGGIRVLIGSTEKLGTGTNVQERLAAIHNLDCPWRPSDLEQRLGRIKRQGNQYHDAKNYRYVTIGTFDAYKYQTAQRKQEFIAQVITNDNPGREASDIDQDALSYAEIKALATGDPTVARRMTLENRINQLRLIRHGFARQRENLADDIRYRLKPQRDKLAETLRNINDDQDMLLAADGKQPDPVIEGRYTGDMEHASARFHAAAQRLAIGEQKTIGTWRGLPVIAACDAIWVKDKRVIRQRIGLHARHVNWSDRQLGERDATRQLDQIIEDAKDAPDRLRRQLAETERDLEQAQEIYDTPWDRQNELDELTKELAELDKENKEPQNPTAGATNGPADTVHDGPSPDPTVDPTGAATDAGASIQIS